MEYLTRPFSIRGSETKFHKIMAGATQIAVCTREDDADLIVEALTTLEEVQKISDGELLTPDDVIEQLFEGQDGPDSDTNGGSKSLQP